MNGEFEWVGHYPVIDREAETVAEKTADESRNTLFLPYPEANSTNAEDTLKVEIGRKRSTAVRRLCRAVTSILVAVGVTSYGYLGYLGFGYVKNGGFMRFVASEIFGGAVTVADSPTDIGAQIDDPVQDVGEVEHAEREFLTISAEDIGCSDPNEVFNETDYDIDEETLQVSAVPKYKTGDTVLIIHTHGTEAYAPEGEVYADEDFRTDDTSENVVAVGAAFAETLRGAGVNVIHCTEMFDRESYIDAYSRSGKAVTEYMKKYPDITCVIDIHRDAVIRENGTVVKTDAGGTAQLMLVMGTDEMGADFPNWRENFLFGREYQHRLYERNENLVRHMNLRGASFNQQLCRNYILLEVGSCGNTLAEAVASAKIGAEIFGEMLTDN